MPFHPAFIDTFENISKDLAPSRNYLPAVRTAATSIFKQLTSDFKNYKTSIDRCRLAGSFANGTAIAYKNGEGAVTHPGVDCVVFINEAEPPFEKSTLEKILKLLEHDPCVEKVAKRTYQFQFNYKSENVGVIKFGLSLAANYADVPSGTPGFEVVNVQTSKALLAIAERQAKSLRIYNEISKHENRLCRSNFTEQMKSFMKDHVSNELTLKIIRVAKYWGTKVDLNGEYISPKIIELVAIHAAMQMASNSDVVDGFLKFLDIMANLHCLNLSFNDKVHDSFIKQLKPALPTIIDPVNPFDNVAIDITKPVIRTFETQAVETTKVVLDLGRIDGYVYETLETATDKIFRHKW